MQFSHSGSASILLLLELCPGAERIAPGVYTDTSIETAFLLSYPIAKAQHPYAKIRIQIERDHSILRAGDVIYDPISDALGVRIDYWTDAVIVKEKDFSEWWAANVLGYQYHPSISFITGVKEVAMTLSTSELLERM